MTTSDESKRTLNLQKHGTDFRDAEAIFDGPAVAAEDKRLAYGERHPILGGGT